MIIVLAVIGAVTVCCALIVAISYAVFCLTNEGYGGRGR